MATLEDRLQKKLVKQLATIDFGKRYYAFQKKHKGDCMDSYAAADIRDALDQFPMKFTHNKRENFYSSAEKHDGFRLWLNIRVTDAVVEFVLNLEKGAICIGGPFAGLAEEVVALRGRANVPNPAWPRPAFATLEELSEILKFGIALFQEAREVILSSGAWVN